ncbi:MAG: hypothetical protein K0S54_1287 [Alphaproteobacteria bacterium]|jgi:hypothetical protein|nr:hypothetical protein [Alphaproteobacteria bacterium]
MPLPASVERQHLHTRQIECRGFFRSDGLWDIEGHIKDNKTYAHESGKDRVLTPDDPVHEMWIRLTIDEHFLIHDVEAVSDHTPYAICPAITPNFKRLIGLSVAKGFRRAARGRLGGRDGCVHLVELLGPVATVAFQTIQAERAQKLIAAHRAKSGKPPLRQRQPGEKVSVIDTCHAWAADGDAVRRNYPDLYTGSKT